MPNYRTPYGLPYGAAISGQMAGFRDEQARAWEDIEYNKLYDRLLSPSEWDKIDESVKKRFGGQGYMGYLNSFQQRKNLFEQREKSFQKAQEGTYEIPEYRMSLGGTPPASKRGIIKEMGGVPEYRIRKDIRGNVTYEPIGGGVRRGLGGEVIPESLETKQTAEELRYAIPSTEEETLGNYLMKKAKRVTAAGTIALPKSEIEAAKLAQAQQRINQSQERVNITKDRLTQQYKIFEERYGNQKALLQLSHDLRQKSIQLREDLRTDREEDQQAFQWNITQAKGELMDTPESTQKAAQYVARAIKIASATADIKAKAQDKEYNQNLLKDLEDQLARLEIKQTESMYSKQYEPLITRTKQKIQSQQKSMATEKTPSYPDEASAIAAGHPSGTIVLINGRKARID